MFNIGSQELLVILIIALIVVGPARLPELSRSIGKGLREFRKVQDEVKDMVKLDLEPEKTPVQRKPASPTAPRVHRTPRPATTAATEPPAPADAAATSPGAPASDPTPEAPSTTPTPDDPATAG
jgi:Tat protein translocase TatB subunit